jgi:hypothetical protein
MWLWPVNEMTELVLCFFFKLHVRLTCLRIPPGVRVPQVEYHCCTEADGTEVMWDIVRSSDLLNINMFIPGSSTNRNDIIPIFIYFQPENYRSSTKSLQILQFAISKFILYRTMVIIYTTFHNIRGNDHNANHQL